MLIKTIKLKNFRQYKDAEIEFSLDKDKNTTVILGENGYGKTTLIRAFNWCLYRENDFKHNKDLLNSQIADKMPCDSDQIVKVTLDVEHNGREYTITTKEIYHKDSEGNVYKKSKASTEVSVYDGKQFNDFDSNKATNIINLILKEDMRNFFFYDGESNEIDDITNKQNLKNAVSVMMEMKNIELLRDYFDASKKNSVVGRLNNEIIKKNLTELDGNTDFTLNNINEKKEEKTTELEKQKIMITENNDEIRKLKSQLVEKNKIIRSNMKVKEDQYEKEQLEDKNKKFLENYEKDFQYFINLLGDGRNKKHSFLNILFENCYQKYDIESLKDKTSFRDEDSISNITEDAVDQLIQRGYCLCGAPIKNGNDAYKHLLEARNHMEPHDYAAYLTKFVEGQQVMKNMNERFIQEFTRQFNDYLDKIDQYDGNVEKIKDLNDKIKNAPDIGRFQKEAEQIQSQINKLENENRYSKEYKIEELKKEINSLQNKMQEIIDKTGDCEVISVCMDLSKDIYNSALIHLKKSEKEVKDVLQEETNDLFKKMYHGDRSIQIGKNFEIITKTDGKELDNSTGIDTVKNFAFVAGMMKTAKKHIVSNDTFKVSGDDVYPLVMDAPFSNTDELHIENICKVLPNCCDQLVLCMINKDYMVASGHLDNKIGRKYKIVKISETEDRIEEVE